LIQAIEPVWPQSLRIRCGAHKAHDVLDTGPETARAAIKAHLAQIREAATLADGQQAIQRFREALEKRYPSATKRLLDDCEASLNHLRVPPAHRTFVRTTNLLERTSRGRTATDQGHSPILDGAQCAEAHVRDIGSGESALAATDHFGGGNQTPGSITPTTGAGSVTGTPDRAI